MKEYMVVAESRTGDESYQVFVEAQTMSEAVTEAKMRKYPFKYGEDYPLFCRIVRTETE